MLSISLDQLKSIEHARTALRADIGSTICERFSINQRWLATGQLPQKPFISAFAGYFTSVPHGTTYAFAYDDLLETAMDAYFAALKALQDGSGSVKDLGKVLSSTVRQESKFASLEAFRDFVFENHLVRLLSVSAGRLPAKLFPLLYEELDTFLEAFEEKHRLEIRQHELESAKVPTRVLIEFRTVK